MMAVQVQAGLLVGGRDYPRSEAEFRAWFRDDEVCRDYLEWLRWPDDFVCDRCGLATAGVCRLADGSWWCGGCRSRRSVTAGTIFHRTRTPLTVWFAAAWYMTSTKAGVSAVTLHRLLGFGSYQTAWMMAHRYRTAMVRPGRARLSGDVEVDETFIGGTKPGKRGRGAQGKTLVAVAVERLPTMGFGRARLAVVSDAKAPTLRAFLLDHVEPGSTVITDGHRSYPQAAKGHYTHRKHVISSSGVQAHVPLPGVHRVASLVKRWLEGTHHGAVESDHLQTYLDEFSFRFNRRNSKNRGLLFRRLLEQAIEAPPVTYRDIVANPKTMTPLQRSQLALPPTDKHVAPDTLAIHVEALPWRSQPPGA